MNRGSFIKSSSMASFGLGFTYEKTFSSDSNISDPIVKRTWNIKNRQQPKPGLFYNL